MNLGAAAFPGTCAPVCPFVRVGDQAFISLGKRLLVYTPGSTGLSDLGSADAVFPTSDGRSLLVVLGRQVEQRTVRGKLSGGPWQIPTGYLLTSPERATAAGILVERITVSFPLPLSEWNPVTGALRQLGSDERVIDTYTAPGSPTSTIAATDCATSSSPCWLNLIDSATGKTVRIASPIPGDPVRRENGFDGGGAFSPDGSQLAVFVREAAVLGPQAKLGIVDLRRHELRLIDGSDVGLGELFGYASWSPSGQSLFFGGLSETANRTKPRVMVLQKGSTHAYALSVAGDYSLVAVQESKAGTANSSALAHGTGTDK